MYFQTCDPNVPSSESHQRLTHYPLHAGYPLDNPQSYIPHDHLLSQHRPNNNRWESFGELEVGHISGQVNPGQTSGQVNSGQTSGQIKPGHTSGQVNSGHTSGQFKPGQSSGNFDPPTTTQTLESIGLYPRLDCNTNHNPDIDNDFFNRGSQTQTLETRRNCRLTQKPTYHTPDAPLRTDLLINWTNLTDNTSKEN